MGMNVRRSVFLHPKTSYTKSHIGVRTSRTPQKVLCALGGLQTSATKIVQRGRVPLIGVSGVRNWTLDPNSKTLNAASLEAIRPGNRLC